MIYTVGHPNGSIKEATTSCDTVLVSVHGPTVDKLIADNAYYRAATIPGGMYSGSPDDVKTFGVGATFVSSTNTPSDTVSTRWLRPCLRTSTISVNCILHLPT